MKLISSIAAICVVFLSSSCAHAEMLEADSSHFHFVIEENSDLSPDEVWEKLSVPANWWSSDHTYSGDAHNMTLDLQAGGLWREDWDGGSVAHGRVLYAKPNQLLRLEAPFGPLQELAVDAVWTISIRENTQGSTVKFEFVANGSEFSGLDKLAPAVEMVKTSALKSLVATDED